MAIPFSCECGKQLSAREQFAGRRMKCPMCARTLTIPSPDADVRSSMPASVEVSASSAPIATAPTRAPQDLPPLPALDGPTDLTRSGDRAMHEFDKTKTRNILALIVAVISF